MNRKKHFYGWGGERKNAGRVGSKRIRREVYLPPGIVKTMKDRGVPVAEQIRDIVEIVESARSKKTYDEMRIEVLRVLDSAYLNVSAEYEG